MLEVSRMRAPAAAAADDVPGMRRQAGADQCTCAGGSVRDATGGNLAGRDHGRQSAAVLIRLLPIRLFVTLALVTPGLAAPAVAAEPLVCFTPGENCTGIIVDQIDGARHSILVQAYSFTSVPILAALKAAHGRGTDVRVLLDKSSARISKSGSRYSAANYLTNAGIPVWVDMKPAIAHNKVMVIDGLWVITGSFNFTASAQNRNAENLLVIEDPVLAGEYRANWERRRAVSMPYAGALPSAAEPTE
jgi:phosphatidylserine/phosphatidylglycerophosphate/cardiolipin synthase-like enzyme